MKLDTTTYINPKIRKSPSFNRPSHSFCEPITGWGQKRKEERSHQHEQKTRFEKELEIRDHSLRGKLYHFFSTVPRMIWKSLLQKKFGGYFVGFADWEIAKCNL